MKLPWRRARTYGDTLEEVLLSMRERDGALTVNGHTGIIEIAGTHAVAVLGDCVGKHINEFISERLRAEHDKLRAEYMANPSVRLMSHQRTVLVLRPDGVEQDCMAGLGPLGGSGVLVIVRPPVMDKILSDRLDAATVLVENHVVRRRFYGLFTVGFMVLAALMCATLYFDAVKAQQACSRAVTIAKVEAASVRAQARSTAALVKSGQRLGIPQAQFDKLIRQGQAQTREHLAASITGQSCSLF
jgi:hypothetical protein